jgi:L-cysteine/cystine lyase
LSERADGRWAWYREETPAALAYVYLNAGWSGAMTRPVASAMRDYLDRELALGPTTKVVFDQRIAMREEYRALAGRMVGATAEEITIADNTTEGINLVLNGLTFEKGAGVVTTTIEHPSGAVPAYYLRERFGADLRFVKLTSEDSPGEAAERFAAAIDDRTKMVLISEISFATGQTLPLREICDIAHRHGAQVLVDGAQTLGHIPIDVRRTNVDYYAFPAHKWLCGPSGIGGLFVRQDLIEGLQPAKVAGKAATEWDFEGHFAPKTDVITKFELTTISTVLVAGAIAAGEQYLESGPEHVFDRVRELNRIAETRFGRIPRVRITSPTIEATRTGLFAFQVAGEEAARVSTYLQSAAKVVCRSVASENAVRLSLHVYNTAEDIEVAASAVETAIREGIPEEIEGAGGER